MSQGSPMSKKLFANNEISDLISSMRKIERKLCPRTYSDLDVIEILYEYTDSVPRSTVKVERKDTPIIKKISESQLLLSSIVKKINNFDEHIKLKFVNIEKDPLKVKDVAFIYEINTSIYSKSSDIDCGKWMLFYEKKIISDNWYEIKKLYNQGELSGVKYIKCSTSGENPDATSISKTHGVIMFYCAESSNEKEILKIGETITKKVSNYKTSYGNIYYKSNQQSTNGSRTSGQKINHKYSLKIHSSGIKPLTTYAFIEQEE
jgi:hypothetical protein